MWVDLLQLRPEQKSGEVQKPLPLEDNDPQMLAYGIYRYSEDLDRSLQEFRVLIRHLSILCGKIFRFHVGLDAEFFVIHSTCYSRVMNLSLPEIVKGDCAVCLDLLVAFAVHEVWQASASLDKRDY